jgi:diguanylate cyclase (GGDEF)-like protein
LAAVVSPAVRRDHAILIRVGGASENHVVFLTKEPLRVGRGTESGLRIDEDDVSRAHAEVRFEDGRHVVVDLGSKNGVSVRGQRAAQAFLADGDVVQFGSHAAFRYTLMDGVEVDLVQRLYDSSVRDPLTRAYNRRHFEERLATEIAYAVRHRADLGLLLMDLDRFKSVNDTYGHRGGDAVLTFVAALTMARLRTEDLFARYGGEEFVVLLRGNDLASATKAAQRLRGAIAGSTARFESTLIPVTVSIGVASLHALAAPTADALVAAADERLYAAKKGGRNQVVAT